MNQDAKLKLKAHRKHREELDRAHDEALRLDRIRTEEFSRIRPLRIASTGLVVIPRRVGVCLV